MEIPSSVSMIGLGKLGLPFAACLAEAGFKVTGVDLNADLVAKINRGECPYREPGLDGLLQKHSGKNLRATTSHAVAVADSSVTFILTATPSKADGSFSNDYIEVACRSVGQAIRKKGKERHTVVISSTVAPGSTESYFIPILEKESGRKVGNDLGVAFDPDFVALGNVIEGFTKPDLVILGESDLGAGEVCESIHRKMCHAEAKIFRMSLINAEIAKICLNAYITTKLSFANMVALLCEKIPGGDCDKITRAIGVDKRISPYYFTGGMAYGGTCFPRDTHALSQLLGKHGIPAPLMSANQTINDMIDGHLASLVDAELEGGGKVLGIVGLSFKENTPVVMDSTAVKLLRLLKTKPMKCLGYDPLVPHETFANLPMVVSPKNSLKELFAEADVIVLTHRSKKMKDEIESFAHKSGTTIIDCWRILDRERISPECRIHRVGVYN
jgi:UDPglucose 6-dehydrogenase